MRMSGVEKEEWWSFVLGRSLEMWGRIDVAQVAFSLTILVGYALIGKGAEVQ
jgi:hypothetical protein